MISEHMGLWVADLTTLSPLRLGGIRQKILTAVMIFFFFLHS